MKTPKVDNFERIDLEGIVSLVKGGGRIGKIGKEYWGHCQVNKSENQYSYRITLIDTDELGPGESTNAKLRFKFGTIKELGITIDKNTVLQLNEGGRNIGTLEVKNVFS